MNTVKSLNDKLSTLNFGNMITYNVDGVKMPSIKKRDTSAWIKAVAASYGKKVGDIAYIFCNDDKILFLSHVVLCFSLFVLFYFVLVAP